MLSPATPAMAPPVTAAATGRAAPGTPAEPATTAATGLPDDVPAPDNDIGAGDGWGRQAVGGPDRCALAVLASRTPLTLTARPHPRPPADDACWPDRGGLTSVRGRSPYPTAGRVDRRDRQFQEDEDDGDLLRQLRRGAGAGRQVLRLLRRSRRRTSRGGASAPTSRLPARRDAASCAGCCLADAAGGTRRGPWPAGLCAQRRPRRWRTPGPLPPGRGRRPASRAGPERRR